jgi:hypothetical protein
MQIDSLIVSGFLVQCGSIQGPWITYTDFLFLTSSSILDFTDKT